MYLFFIVLASLCILVYIYNSLNLNKTLFAQKPQPPGGKFFTPPKPGTPRKQPGAIGTGTGIKLGGGGQKPQPGGKFFTPKLGTSRKQPGGIATRTKPTSSSVQDKKDTIGASGCPSGFRKNSSGSQCLRPVPSSGNCQDGSKISKSRNFCIARPQGSTGIKPPGGSLRDKKGTIGTGTGTGASGRDKDIIGTIGAPSCPSGFQLNKSSSQCLRPAPSSGKCQDGSKISKSGNFCITRPQGSVGGGGVPPAGGQQPPKPQKPQTGGSGSGSGNTYVPEPSQKTLENNAYPTGGSRFQDNLDKLSSQTGVTIFDTRNFTGGTRKDPSKFESVAEAVEKMQSNGGVPIAYMSLSLERDYDDVKQLSSSSIGSRLPGWGKTESVPKGGAGGRPTKEYMDMMKKRIKDISSMGVTVMEFDNIDMIDYKQFRDGGITPEGWKSAIKELVRYANGQGITVMQKNTPGNTGTSLDKSIWDYGMTDLFGGMIIEMKGSSKAGTSESYNWDVVAEYLKDDKPVILNTENIDCAGAKRKIREFTGISSSDNLIC